jgi:DNA invertase Pin-like site-specific DNA recombinase
MADGKWISYLRVSTDRQGKSGLGIEAQRSAVGDYLNGGNWSLVKEFVEVESGKRTDRPMLAEAIKACRVYGAKLVIAKLDRLSRDAHFLLGLEKAGVDFVAADMPNANRLTVGIMAMVAEEERRMISKRTKDALCGSRVSFWPTSEVRRCPLFRRYRGHSGSPARLSVRYAPRDLKAALRPS